MWAPILFICGNWKWTRTLNISSAPGCAAFENWKACCCPCQLPGACPVPPGCFSPRAPSVLPVTWWIAPPTCFCQLKSLVCFRNNRVSLSWVIYLSGLCLSRVTLETRLCQHCLLVCRGNHRPRTQVRVIVVIAHQVQTSGSPKFRREPIPERPSPLWHITFGL